MAPDRAWKHAERRVAALVGGQRTKKAGRDDIRRAFDVGVEEERIVKKGESVNGYPLWGMA